MIGALLSGLPLIGRLFNTVDNITNAIKDERIAKIKAKTEEERIASDERINQLSAIRDVKIAKTGFAAKWDAIATFLLSIPVIVIDFKFLVIDKFLGSLLGCNLIGMTTQQLNDCHKFRTDGLTTEMWVYIGAVHAFYFLYLAVKK
jgi:hypothetical protein